MGGAGAGGRVPPGTFHREIFGEKSGKMRQGKKGKNKMYRKMRQGGKSGKLKNGDWKRGKPEI